MEMRSLSCVNVVYARDGGCAFLICGIRSMKMNSKSEYLYGETHKNQKQQRHRK